MLTNIRKYMTKHYNNLFILVIGIVSIVLISVSITKNVYSEKISNFEIIKNLELSSNTGLVSLGKNKFLIWNYVSGNLRIFDAFKLTEINLIKSQKAPKLVLKLNSNKILVFYNDSNRIYDLQKDEIIDNIKVDNTKYQLSVIKYKYGGNYKTVIPLPYSSNSSSSKNIFNIDIFNPITQKTESIIEGIDYDDLRNIFFVDKTNTLLILSSQKNKKLVYKYNNANKVLSTFELYDELYNYKKIVRISDELILFIKDKSVYFVKIPDFKISKVIYLNNLFPDDKKNISFPSYAFALKNNKIIFFSKNGKENFLLDLKTNKIDILPSVLYPNNCRKSEITQVYSEIKPEKLLNDDFLIFHNCSNNYKLYKQSKKVFFNIPSSKIARCSPDFKVLNSGNVLIYGGYELQSVYDYPIEIFTTELLNVNDEL